ncbi:hypothetical protein ABTD55_23990, partial [Acinetobacter baumannii]
MSCKWARPATVVVSRTQEAGALSAPPLQPGLQLQTISSLLVHAYLDAYRAHHVSSTALQATEAGK